MDINKKAEEIKKKIGKNKKTPKFGYTMADSLPFPVFKNDSFIKQFKNFFDLQDVSDNILDRLENAGQKYNIANKINKKPAEAQIEAALLRLVTAIEKGSNKFEEVFKRIDSVTKDRLATVGTRQDCNMIYGKQKNIKIDRLLILIEKAVCSITKNRSKQKRTEAPLREFLVELCSIYKKLTGKEPSVSYNNHTRDDDDQRVKGFTSHFYNFVYLMMQIIDPAKLEIDPIKEANPDKFEADTRLGNQIKQSIKIYKKNLTS